MNSRQRAWARRLELHGTQLRARWDSLAPAVREQRAAAMRVDLARLVAEVPAADPVDGRRLAGLVLWLPGAAAALRARL